MFDRVLITLPSSPPVIVRWAYGVQTLAYFQAGNGFDITATYTQGIPAINATYTVYALLANGFEAVASIQVDRIRNGTPIMPYLLLNFPTAASLDSAIPGIGQFNLYFMQGGGEKLRLHYELYESIEMSGRAWEPLGQVEPGFPFRPLAAFTGSLVGNGNAIMNLILGSPAETRNQGFFAAVADGAIVRNLQFINCTVTSRVTSACVAAIAEIVNGGEILFENLAFQGSVLTNIFAGGLLGSCPSSNGTFIINNCAVNADIRCTEVGGGLIGYSELMSADARVIINGCITRGSVETVGDSAAGMIAICAMFSGGSCSITNSLNAMSLFNNANRSAGMIALVVGNGNWLISSCANLGNATSRASTGGLVASANIAFPTPGSITIENCYNTGTIVMTSSSDSNSGAGGLLGDAEGPLFIFNSYSIGDVVCPNFNNDVGVGGISSNFGTIRNCVAGCELVANNGSPVARISPTLRPILTADLHNNLAWEGMQVLQNGVPKFPLDTGISGTDGISITTAQLTSQATYENLLGWNFTAIWSFGNGSYSFPILRSLPASLQPM